MLLWLVFINNNMSWVRNTMYERLKPLVETYQEGNALLLGGPSQITNYLSKDIKITVTNYPEVDMECTGYDNETWDYVITDQCLEHVKHPWIAVKEMYRILKRGGTVICTTCSYNPLHNVPIDCYRFFPDGMKALFEEFSNVKVDTWGSKEAIIDDINIGRNRVSEENQIKYLEQDDKVFPWVIWVVATKKAIIHNKTISKSSLKRHKKTKAFWGPKYS